MLTVSLSPGKYTNESAPENVLHYLSSNHNRDNDHRECLMFFSPNMIGSAEQMAYYMKVTQRLYRSYTSSFKKINHLVVTLDEKVLFRQPLYLLAWYAAWHFASLGFQTAASVFHNYDDKVYEVHLAINSINAFNGMVLKLHADLLAHLQELFSCYFQLISNP